MGTTGRGKMLERVITRVGLTFETRVPSKFSNNGLTIKPNKTPSLVSITHDQSPKEVAGAMDSPAEAVPEKEQGPRCLAIIEC